MKLSKFLVVTTLTLASWAVLAQTSFAASLYISPSSGNFSVGSSFTLRILTNTQGATINSGEADVSFNSDILELTRVSSGSTFPLQTPGSPSKTNSSASFSGGVPTPGYTGNGGVVGIMTFRAKKEGVGKITINSGKILLNDGNGTDALTSTQGATINVTPPAVSEPKVTSTTHPDQNLWYQAQDVELSWVKNSNMYGFSFIFDQNPETIPDDTLDTTITTTASYKKQADGVWYFHIKARGNTTSFGSTAHYKVQIDRTPPLAFEINLVGQNNLNSINNTPTIEFSAQDSLSGIDHYELITEDSITNSSDTKELKGEVVTSPYTFAKLSSGPHIIKIIAVDKAGNKTLAQVPVVVTGPQQVTETVTSLVKNKIQLPVLVLLGINILMLLIIFYLLHILLKQRKHQNTNDPILHLQNEINKNLEDLKIHINNELSKYAKQTSAKDRKLSTYINDNITESEEVILNKIGKVKKKK